MNVVIVEDEKLTARRLEKLLTDYDPAIRVLAVLPSVSQGVAWFADPANRPDLLFLDIHLEDDSGFRLVEQAVFPGKPGVSGRAGCYQNHSYLFGQ